MGKELRFTEDYLQDAISHIGSSLVGKIMKRFELSSDKDAIKVQCKELVYEELRHLKDILFAFEKGKEVAIKFTSFEFKSKQLPKQN